ncbi:putative methyltransferase-domain-containing protein [Umbelopsis sp. PMI_123]|nr:putative methyltransferase-domain-containing protein [Umbelopsis sp. PMI_123]
MPSQDNDAFRIGNLPEGLNVTASDGPPIAFKSARQNELHLTQDISQFGLAGKIWHSAYALDIFLSESNQSYLQPVNPIPQDYYLGHASRPYRILELGAGTGYVGIALARRLSPECKIYITDLAEVTPLIQQNVDHYQATVTAQIAVQPLNWGDREHGNQILEEGEIDLVIVSDCVYFPELFGVLTETLLQVCSMNTKVVIGYKSRSLEKETGFWQDFFGCFFEYEPVRKITQPTNDPENSDEEPIEEIFGQDEELYIFIGQKRPPNEYKKADDTFTTLLFCTMNM